MVPSRPNTLYTPVSSFFSRHSSISFLVMCFCTSVRISAVTCLPSSISVGIDTLRAFLVKRMTCFKVLFTFCICLSLWKLQMLSCAVGANAVAMASVALSSVPEFAGEDSVVRSSVIGMLIGQVLSD